MCEFGTVGTVGKISGCQPEGPRLNPQHTAHGQGHLVVCLVDTNILLGDLKEPAHLSISRLMPMLWSVTSSPTNLREPDLEETTCPKYCLCSHRVPYSANVVNK